MVSSHGLIRRPAANAHRVVIEADVEQRLTAIRRVWSKGSCLSDCLADVFVSVNLRVNGVCAWYGKHYDGVRPHGQPASVSRLSSVERQSGLQVVDQKANIALIPRSSVTRRRLCGCTVVPLQSQRDARFRPLLDVALGLGATEGYVHHRERGPRSESCSEWVKREVETVYH